VAADPKVTMGNTENQLNLYLEGQRRQEHQIPLELGVKCGNKNEEDQREGNSKGNRSPDPHPHPVLQPTRPLCCQNQRGS